MPRTAARIIVSLWLLGGCLPGAAVAQTPGALEVTLKAGEAPGAAAAGTVKLYSASKALVVGIDAYSAGWPRLSMAVKDAKAVAEALKLQGFEVTLVSDPAQEELERAFKDFFIKGGADAEARLFVWFAGHGHTIKNGGGDDEGYIVPRDAPNLLTSDLDFRSNAISLRRFGEYMREARAKHVLAVFDSCFGGTVFNVARALPPAAITHATGLPVRQFISSGDADQEVGDDGAFRKLFIDALEGAEPAANANRDGYLTGTGLGQFLYTKMTNLTEKRQTPRYGKLNARGYDRGDFVFQVREPKAAPVPKAEAAQAWADIKELKNAAVFEAFRKQYGAANPLYDTLASQRIEELKAGSAPGQGGAAASWWPWGAPGPQPQPAKPPETQTAVVAPKTPPAPAISVPTGVSLPTSRPAPPEPACDGLLVAVAMGKKPCIKPGSGKSFQDCPDCPEMVIAPAGSFSMGSPENEPERANSEGPLHKVTIAEPFAVGRFAVTWDEFEAFVKDSGHQTDGGCYVWMGRVCNNDSANSWRSPGFTQTGAHPVVCVNWDDAKAYVAWLSKKTGKEYRLLSEAEREYVARAGRTTPFWWGSQILVDQANYNGSYTYNGSHTGEYRQKTLPVKSFDPNPWGLYQVHGNVWDWVEDCWHVDYHNAPSDGSAWTAGDCSYRVLRGGTWGGDPQSLRAAFRSGSGLNPVIRYNLGGFRVALGWQDLNR